MSERRTAAVILAAGASRRLGQPKQLVRVAGESLLRRTARLAVEVECAPVFVVLGFAAERMCPELDGLSVQPLTNLGWTEGMGASLRCGVAAAQASGAEAILLLVCDQPQLSMEHLRALLKRHSQGQALITASSYEGRSGVPAIFSAKLFPELVEIRGDRGARQVIEGYGDAVQRIAWAEGGLDVDSLEQLRTITLE